MLNKKIVSDANTAVAHVAYQFSEVMAIYPITPSSSMAETSERAAVSKKENLFGEVPEIKQMQSEAGVAGAIHGALTCGALASTFSSSQGLLLMIPNMYKIAGELLPGVIHVAARTLATHALSILGDHSDVYACRQTGFAMLCSNNPQEAQDFAAISHLCSIKSKVPFLHFFDGFVTSHEIQKINILDHETLKNMLDKNSIEDFRNRALNPENPKIRGMTQNEDIFFQVSESRNKFYDAVPDIVENCMAELKTRTGRSYAPFEYYGDPQAEDIVVAMGSVCGTAEETVDYINQNGGKAGLVKVRLYRPFSSEHFLAILPKTVKKISVLDRTKEPGSIGEPLFLDVLAATNEFSISKVLVFSGRYGLSSKDTIPSEILAVFENMQKQTPKKRFTIGINDDVTNLSLKPVTENIENPKLYSCKFFGFGSDGTVSAVKNAAKIIGENTENEIQANFHYDSKKSGGLTISDLRFGNTTIKSGYSIKNSDFIACHNFTYIFKYDILNGLKKNGVFLLNCSWSEKNLNDVLPSSIKKYIIENNINFYIINANNIAKEIGLGRHINTIMCGAFFKILDVISESAVKNLLKKSNEITYKSKGEKIIEINDRGIEEGFNNLFKIDSNTLIFDNDTENLIETTGNDYFNKIVKPIEERKGNNLPVSAFLDYADGTFPTKTFENNIIKNDLTTTEFTNSKSGSKLFSTNLIKKTPKWIPENCIQCNFCSISCPHAVIRPAVLSEEELKNAPSCTQFKKMLGFNDFNFSIVVSEKNCTSCGICVNVCPGMREKKALEMVDYTENAESIFKFATNLSEKSEVFKRFPKTTVKGSQFEKPLLEFSGACAGCGETPYAKLITQIFGSRLIIANATGCSSIWGGSAPLTPYTVNSKGQGPAWHNSLFEDNAEFGFGMVLAQNVKRKKILNLIKKLKIETENNELKNLCQNYIDSFENGEKNQIISENIIDFLKHQAQTEIIGEILKNKNFVSKKSIWLFGGDGWAYDIGFGGLDHAIASGIDVNILVFDTEVYSNTGGQSSKSTPLGAKAQFASVGKETPKKNLSAMLSNYKNAYIAQVSLGADYNQTLKAFIEAESFKGPSIVIAYSPCINHGIKKGMSAASETQKLAVETGYWDLFRIDPRKEIPFQNDSSKISKDLMKFFESERRFKK